MFPLLALVNPIRSYCPQRTNVAAPEKEKDNKFVRGDTKNWKLLQQIEVLT